MPLACMRPIDGLNGKPGKLLMHEQRAVAAKSCRHLPFVDSMSPVPGTHKALNS